MLFFILHFIGRCIFGIFAFDVLFPTVHTPKQIENQQQKPINKTDRNRSDNSFSKTVTKPKKKWKDFFFPWKEKLDIFVHFKTRTRIAYASGFTSTINHLRKKSTSSEEICTSWFTAINHWFSKRRRRTGRKNTTETNERNRKIIWKKFCEMFDWIVIYTRPTNESTEW